MWGRGVYFLVQPRLPYQESGVPGLLQFLEVLLYLNYLHPLTQNDRSRHGNTYGDWRVLRCQPRHCICTNASRGFSATAEFLV